MNSVAVIPAPVDDNGNLSYIFTEGLMVPIREIDISGNEINISNLPRFFTANNGGFRIPLSLDPNNPKGRRLDLTIEDLKKIPNPCLFSVTDESGLMPVSIWDGILAERTINNG